MTPSYIDQLAAQLTDVEFQELQARVFVRQAVQCWDERSAEERADFSIGMKEYLVECAGDICCQGMYSSNEVPTLIRTVVEKMFNS